MKALTSNGIPLFIDQFGGVLLSETVDDQSQVFPVMGTLDSFSETKAAENRLLLGYNAPRD